MQTIISLVVYSVLHINFACPLMAEKLDTKFYNKWYHYLLHQLQ